MTHQSYLDPLAKTSVCNSPAPWKLPIFGSPPPLEISVARRGGGGGGGRDIFWNYTLKTTATTTTHTHTQKKCKNNKVKQ